MRGLKAAMIIILVLVSCTAAYPQEEPGSVKEEPGPVKPVNLTPIFCDLPLAHLSPLP